MPNLSNENIFLLLSSTWTLMDAIVFWDALKPRSYSYLAGGCLESVSHKLPSWRELKLQWKSCYCLQKHMDRKKIDDFIRQSSPTFLMTFFSHLCVWAQSTYESTLNDISILTFHWRSIFFLPLIETSQTIWLQNVSKYPLAAKWK